MSLRLMITKLKPNKNVPKSSRQMTTSKRVKDRSKHKRNPPLESVIEKWKIFSKMHFLMEIISSQPQRVMPVVELVPYREQIGLPRPNKFSDFLKKSPDLFDFYKDGYGVLWTGLTDKAEDWLADEEKEIELHSDKAAEYVTRCLMMSVDRRLRIDKVAHFQRDFGLPRHFKKDWVYRYPHLFRVVKGFGSKCRGVDDGDCLELVGWNEEWAVTDLERRFGKGALAFPLKFPPMFMKVHLISRQLDEFQRTEYVSPYAPDRGLMAGVGSKEFDKRAVAVMHELLSFTLDKRLVTDHLTHFRREMIMPQKLMRLLMNYFAIFYVSEKGKRYHVFLNEGYRGSELIEKSPLVLLREKLHCLIGCRVTKGGPAPFTELSDGEDPTLWNSDSGDEASEIDIDIEQDGMSSILDDNLLGDDAEMDVDEVSQAYRDV